MNSIAVTGNSNNFITFPKRMFCFLCTKDPKNLLSAIVLTSNRSLLILPAVNQYLKLTNFGIRS